MSFFLQYLNLGLVSGNLPMEPCVLLLKVLELVVLGRPFNVLELSSQLRDRVLLEYYSALELLLALLAFLLY